MGRHFNDILLRVNLRRVQAQKNSRSYYIFGDEDQQANMANRPHAYGSLGPYSSGKETWIAYCERLEQYFAANDIDDAGKQRAVLLSECGSETYQLIRSLVAPEKPKNKTFDALVKLVADHLTPPPSPIVQRFHFNTRTQKEGETVAAFLAELRRLSEHCEYGETLDDMLRDRLVCGIRDIRVQRHLLAESKLTLKKAFEMAQGAELADKHSKALHKQPPSTSPGVNRVATFTKPKALATAPCTRCGGKHSPKTCRFKDYTCRSCEKKGHLAKVCRSKTQHYSKRQPQQRKPLPTHQVHEDTTEDQSDYSEEDSWLMNVYSVKKSTPITVNVEINSIPLNMEVDTGASASLISMATYKSMWLTSQPPPLKQTDVKLRTYTGERLQIAGMLTVDVTHKGQTKQLPLLVVEGKGPSLLGRDWLEKLTLDWQQVHRLHTTGTLSLNDVLSSHPDVFKDELGEVKGVEAKITVDPTVTPRFYRPRPVAYTLRPKVEQ